MVQDSRVNEKSTGINLDMASRTFFFCLHIAYSKFDNWLRKKYPLQTSLKKLADNQENLIQKKFDAFPLFFSHNHLSVR